ncbi:MAG TPA: hypothetical protein VIB48_13415, partial [Acidimicrobiia bacterium]
MLSVGSDLLLRTVLLHGAVAAAAVCVALFLADVISHLAVRVGRAVPALLRLERRSPRPLRRLAQMTATALLAIAVARPAGASPTPVRDWLSSTTTAATTAPPVARPAPVPMTTSTPTPSSTSPTSTTTAGGPTPPAPAAPTPAPAA